MNTDRLLGIVIVLTIVVVGIIGRLYYIQVYLHDEYVYLAQRQQVGSESIKPDRGLIYDRNKMVLAYSDPEVSFFVSVKQAKKSQTVDKIAENISRITKKVLNTIKT